VRLLHELAKIHATFDDPDLVSRAGLVPVMALAQRAGLGDLAGENVRIARPCGVNAQLKVSCLVAGMAAGADSIDDMDLLRHGAMPALFGGIRAPSTLGSFLRAFTWGNVLQLEKVSRLLRAFLQVRGSPLVPFRHRSTGLTYFGTKRPPVQIRPPRPDGLSRSEGISEHRSGAALRTVIVDICT
jgi:hypothetical protein